MGCNSRICNIILDISCIVLAWIPVVLIKKLGHPAKRGFFCNDPAIQYPLVSSSLPGSVVYGISFGVPVLLIAVVELFRALSTKKYAFRRTPKQEDSLPMHCLSKIFTAIRHFLIWGAVAALLVLIGKLTVGRLRPHFLAACSPAGLESCPIDKWNTYVSETICGSEDEKLLEDARQSFPSGGSAVIFYGMIFAVLYLELRATGIVCLHRLRHLVQGGLVCLAVFVSLRRVAEHRHHATDVLAGAAMSTLLAGVSVYQLSKSLRPKSASLDDSDKPSELIAV